MVITLAVILAILPTASAAGNPCEGIEKTACLNKVRAFVSAGRNDEAALALSYLCTARDDSDGCVGAATVLARQGQIARARPLAARACNTSTSVGCNLSAGLSISTGDYEAARGAYDKACALGAPGACDKATRIRTTIAKRKDLQTACNAGEPLPCSKLAALDQDERRAEMPADPDAAPAQTSVITDPTASAMALARIRAIHAEHGIDSAASDGEISQLCDHGDGYACALTGSAELLEGHAARAKLAVESGCRDRSALACFIRYSIAKTEHNEAQADQYFGLTCRYGGLKYCTDVRERLGVSDRAPAARGE